MFKYISNFLNFKNHLNRLKNSEKKNKKIVLPVHGWGKLFMHQAFPFCNFYTGLECAKLYACHFGKKFDFS